MTCIACSHNSISIDSSAGQIYCAECGMTLSLTVMDMREYGAWVFLKIVIQSHLKWLEENDRTEHEMSIKESLRWALEGIERIGEQSDADVWQATE